ncbi:DUF5666 domain-containing protein [Ruegeria sp. HKCCD8929]|uniref:DUF5666 domain-containing protein n=1 Tax=Ruegeria sp. HKCCD8929 TaxID=2683006 RepID=UPI001488318C|nr:DUF5666 domain-containing protein [Ruegeria sp. HKCCD8929]
MNPVARIAVWLFVFAFGALAAAAQEGEEREGGIIGTGIVGTVTEIGSIYVNGQHIMFDPDLVVSDSLDVVTAGDLRPGHTVAVIAQPEDEIWRATYIRQVLPLVGPVDEIEGQHMTILGTEIRAAGRIESVSVGDWIAVSGLWHDDDVRATKLSAVPEDKRQAQISGTFLGRDNQGRVVIGNTAVFGMDLLHLAPGDVVRATGVVAPGGIQALRFETGLFTQPVRIMQVEGYLSVPLPDGLYTILGSGLVAYTRRPGMISTSQKVVQCGAGGALGEVPGEALQDSETRQAAEKLNCGFRD